MSFSAIAQNRAANGWDFRQDLLELETSSRFLVSFLNKNKNDKFILKNFNAYFHGVRQLVRNFNELPKSEKARLYSAITTQIIKLQKLNGAPFIELKSSTLKLRFENVEDARRSFFRYRKPSLAGVNVQGASGAKEPLLLDEKFRIEHLIKGMRSFGYQLFGFGVAEFGLSIPGSISLDNPVSFQQAIDSVFDLKGAAAFGGFVYAHRKTDKYLSRNYSMHPQLRNFMGMGVGLLVSSTLHEIMTDTDLSNCLFGNNQAESDLACIVAAERWFSVDKYVDLIPELVSLGAAATSSHLTLQLAGWVGKKVVPKAMLTTAVESIVAGVMRGRVGATVAMIGNFWLFLKYHEFISPFIRGPWDDYNLHHWGLSESEALKKDKAQFSDAVDTYDESEEEALWVKENIGQLYKYSKSVGTCANPRLYKGSVASEFEDEKRSLREKLYSVTTENVEECIRKANPALILQNSYAFKKAHTNLRLSTFTHKRANWNELLGRFSEMYGISGALYAHIRDIAKALKKDNLSKNEYMELNKQLTQNSLRNFVQAHQKIKVEKIYDNTLNDVKFGHLADYIMYNMACGSSTKTNHLNADNYDDDFSNSAEVDFVKTPFGSSLEFVPPKVTNKSYNICKSIQNRFLRNDQSLGLKEITRRVNERNDIFTGPWFDEDQTGYANLVDFIIQNLDESFLKDEAADFDENNNEFIWWNVNITAHVGKVWEAYDGAFVRLVKEELLPELLTEKVGSYGVIDRAYAKFHNHYQSILKISKLLMTDNTQLSNKLSDLMKLLHQETVIHKNLLRHWNNDEYSELYSSSNNFKDFLGKISDKVNNIEKDLSDNVSEKCMMAYLGNDVVYLKQDSECISRVKRTDLALVELKILNIEISEYMLQITDLTRTLGY